MTENKHFVIDVADEIYENAFFEDGKFVCLEDDFDEILKKFNELADENEQLKQQLRIIIDTAEQNGVITKSELKEIKKEIL